MKVRIQDREALMAISPRALSAYARAAGWSKAEPYGNHSDIYVAEGHPEVILPRTQHLGDYAHIVSQLITIFARVAETDEISLYRDLTMSGWDVIRVRAMGSEADGDVAVSAGLDLVRGAHDMLLAAACSLQGEKRLYRVGANREAQDYLSKVRLGQTEQGSFVVTLLSPVPFPRQQQLPFGAGITPDDPVERQVTQRLADALAATRQATESMARGEDSNVFYHAVSRGVSTNLCEALAMLIEPFSALDISLTWARTRPMATARTAIRFAQDSAPILRKVAQSFRDREPRLDEQLFGFVRSLKREAQETDGTITLQAPVDGAVRSVAVVLNQTDYEQAIQAHQSKAGVSVKGDLERDGQRWRLLNPIIQEIIHGVFPE